MPLVSSIVGQRILQNRKNVYNNFCIKDIFLPFFNIYVAARPRNEENLLIWIAFGAASYLRKRDIFLPFVQTGPKVHCQGQVNFQIIKCIFLPYPEQKVSSIDQRLGNI